MSSKTKLLEQQRMWATSVGANIDTRGYLSSVAENLYQPLSARAFRDFSQGSGSELTDTLSRPAKMKALHSSAALAVNVFDYWTDRNTDPIFAALELDPSAESIAFEAQFPTGLEGKPPNLDLGIRYRNGLVIGVESKFSEWLTPKAPGKAPFKPKYFPESTELWSSRGLAACQTLAREMHEGTARFRYLDAPQLLKHALGLATQHPGSFELYYVYFDWPGPESTVHRSEIEGFESLVRRDFRFHVSTYQELFARLVRATGTEHASYIRYLHERYFPNGPVAGN
jgi:hypothetical protein